MRHVSGGQGPPLWASTAAVNTGCDNKADKEEKKKKTRAIGALEGVRRLTIAVATEQKVLIKISAGLCEDWYRKLSGSRIFIGGQRVPLSIIVDSLMQNFESTIPAVIDGVPNGSGLALVASDKFDSCSIEINCIIIEVSEKSTSRC